jgi:hypothetical protein
MPSSHICQPVTCEREMAMAVILGRARRAIPMAWDLPGGDESQARRLISCLIL